jgi:hypothetical protein
MKKLLTGKYRGIPAGLLVAILLMIIASGAILAAFTVISGTVTIEVGEPVTVQYDWGTGWEDLEDGFEFTITGAYANDSWPLGVRICNASNNDILVALNYVVISGPDGYAADAITISGSVLVSGGLIIPAGSCLERALTGYIAADAPAGNYTVQLDFDRG